MTIGEMNRLSRTLIWFGRVRTKKPKLHRQLVRRMDELGLHNLKRVDFLHALMNKKKGHAVLLIRRQVQTMNAKRAKRANKRRKFFNQGKGALCGKCGAVLVDRLGVKECPVCKA